MIVPLFKPMTLDLAQPRPRQRIRRDRIIRDTLMTRQLLRRGFDGLADSVLSFVAVSRSSGPDQRRERSLFLKHADLANGGLFRLSILDVFGLNFLAALGFDQRRNATEDVQLIVAI